MDSLFRNFFKICTLNRNECNSFFETMMSSADKATDDCKISEIFELVLMEFDMMHLVELLIGRCKYKDRELRTVNERRATFSCEYCISPTPGQIGPEVIVHNNLAVTMHKKTTLTEVATVVEGVLRLRTYQVANYGPECQASIWCADVPIQESSFASLVVVYPVDVLQNDDVEFLFKIGQIGGSKASMAQKLASLETDNMADRFINSSEAILGIHRFFLEVRENRESPLFPVERNRLLRLLVKEVTVEEMGLRIEIQSDGLECAIKELQAGK